MPNELPPQPGQWQSPAPHGYPAPRPPEYDAPARRPKRGRIVVSVIVAVVLVAAGVTGVLMWTGEDRPDLAAGPDLGEIAFPDPGALAYDKGADAACAAVGKTLTTRGYELIKASDDYGVNCVASTPGPSLIEDGAHDFQVTVFMIRGDEAASAYDNFLTAAERTHDKFKSGGMFTVSDVQEFPVGEEGHFYYSEFAGNPNAYANATASFRSGDDTFQIAASGSIVRLGEDNPDEAVSENVMRDEIVDVVKSLSGDGSAGEPRITAPDMADYPGLEDLGEPTLADTAAEQACAPATAVAEQFGLVVDSTDASGASSPTILCKYASAEDIYDRMGDNTVESFRIEIVAKNYSDEAAISPSSELGRDLQTILEETPSASDQELERGKLYRLPAGESGYLIYSRSRSGMNSSAGEKSSARLRAGYVVGNAYYRVEVAGARYPAGSYDPVALPEKELVDRLVRVLTPLSGS